MSLEWTVDYGDGPRPCTIPHSWNQDVPVKWEGPAVYRCRIDVPCEASALRFHGVSYLTVVQINGEQVHQHRGMWDAFDVSLDRWGGEAIEIQVSVTKNGGESFPVKSVLSGFLPFVYHTFGGIYKEVEIVKQESLLVLPASTQLGSCQGSKVYLPDGKPVYPRGLLHWGWYPELGHPNPGKEVIEKEVLAAKDQGFNLIKFCLWVPPHRYLEALEQHNMIAWMELPLWDPSSDNIVQEQMAHEIEAIVGQYRHHKCIALWTIGCELSKSTSATFRERLYDLVKNLTGSCLVTDNSGGAEMYGGDPREFGDFYDFHPYCDTPFYPVVLNSLLPGPRTLKPTFLGEFNDIDVYRDLSTLASQNPFWASDSGELNDQGVRWQHDLPQLLKTHPLAQLGSSERNAKLTKSSRKKAAFMRKFVQENVRLCGDISGYVVTGIRDTPISTSGIFDDSGRSRFSKEEMSKWNGRDCIFLIPQRCPPWIRGGNRPGWVDSLNVEPGSFLWKIGVHSEVLIEATMTIELRNTNHKLVSEIRVEPLVPRQVAEFYVADLVPGDYILCAQVGDVLNEWNIWVPDRLDTNRHDDWSQNEFGSVEENNRTVRFLVDEDTVPMPFWREAAYEFAEPKTGWQQAFFQDFADKWERWLPISPDCCLDPAALPSDAYVLVNRVDMRTFQEHPVLATYWHEGQEVIVTTLRPFGGLGIQPNFKGNPAGRRLFAILTQC